MLVNICPMGNMKTLDNMTVIYHLHSSLRVESSIKDFSQNRFKVSIFSHKR